MSEDLLDTDVSNIDTSYPRLNPSTYDLMVDSIERVENNAHTGHNLKVALKTTSDAISTTGDPIPAGYVLNHNISLVKTPKYDPNKSLATFMKAAKLTGSPKAFAENPVIASGKTITARVGIQKATEQYNESNKINSFEVKA
jgi:hypothetical protein